MWALKCCLKLFLSLPLSFELGLYVSLVVDSIGYLVASVAMETDVDLVICVTGMCQALKRFF